MRSPVPPFALLIAFAAAQGAAADGASAVKPSMREPQMARPVKLKPASRAPLPVAFVPLAGTVRTDAGQCQRGCDQTYYFCLAADETDACPSAWTRCRASCRRGSTAAP